MSEEKNNSFIQKFLKHTKQFKNAGTNKKIQYLAIILIIVIVLAIYFSTLNSSNNDEIISEVDTVKSENISNNDDICKKLENTLSKIQGVGEVDVLITYESEAEIVPAIVKDTQKTSSNENESVSSTQSEQTEVVTVNSNGNENVVILTKKLPKVRGVIVVAQGAENVTTRINIQSAVKTILNIDVAQVEVFDMKE